MSLIAADVFAGGGGLTVGLKRAGFSVGVAVELDNSACTTYRANHPEVRLFRQDVRTISGLSLLDACGGRVDLLAACPPCQGFCSLTRRADEDPRNDLILEVARLAEEMKPGCLMIENVPGLATGKGKTLFDQFLNRLKRADYFVTWAVLQTANFGIPQRRRRLVVLAGREREIPIPAATHDSQQRKGLKLWRSVEEVIGGLPEPAVLDETFPMGGPEAFNWHVIRRLSPQNIARLRAIKAGELRSAIPDELRPKCHQGKDSGFHNVYGRLAWDSPSVTITGGCTTLSKGRFGHPQSDRTISVREAALLQTFPPDYKFPTPHMDHVCNIVGNALPCDFAEQLATHCLGHL